MAIKDKNGIEPSRLTNKYGSDVLRVVDKNGNTLYRQQQEIIWGARVKTQGAYVDTGYKPNNNTSVKCKTSLNGTFSNYPYIVFARDSRSVRYGVVGLSNARTQDSYNNLDNYITTGITYDDVVHDIYKNRNKLYINGILVNTITEATFTVNANLLVLASETAQASIGTTINSNIEIWETQSDGTEKLMRNLYFVPAGNTEHSNVPAPAGGACWCRVTNQYYPVLQNNGVGELEYFPVSVNKQPRTEYSVECTSTGNALFYTGYIPLENSRIKFRASWKDKLSQNAYVIGCHSSGVHNAVWMSTTSTTSSYFMRWFSSIDNYRYSTDSYKANDVVDLEIANSKMHMNGVATTTELPFEAAQQSTLQIFHHNNKSSKIHSSFLIYEDNIDGTSTLVRELIPVPEGDVQYSDIPAPAGGALWCRCTNKYYPKQGTGTLKFRELPRLGLNNTSTNTYLNSGITGSPSLSIFTNVQFNNKNTTGYVYGLHNAEIGGERYSMLQLEANKITAYSGFLSNTSSYIPFDKPARLGMIGNKWSLNGKLYNMTGTVMCTASPNPIFIGCRNTGNGGNSPNYSKTFYSWEVYNNNQLVQNLIPVRQGDTFHKKDSTPAPSNCMYDTVTDTYFENAGTGSFEIVEENPYYTLEDGTELFKGDTNITSFNYDTPYLTNATRMFTGLQILLTLI